VLGARKFYEVYAVTQRISRELGCNHILERRDASGGVEATRLNSGHLLLARSDVAAANLRNQRLILFVPSSDALASIARIVGVPPTIKDNRVRRLAAAAQKQNNDHADCDVFHLAAQRWS
jgi:hypothetical protein